MRDSAHQRILKFLRRLETQITTIDVVGEGERELTMEEVSGLNFFVIYRLQSLLVSLLHLAVAQPFEEKLGRENLVVEDFKPITIKIELS